MSYQRLGFVGFGQMARAICGGVLASPLGNLQFQAFDPSPAAADWIAQLEAPVKICDSNEDLARESDVLLLCVKPQLMPAVFEQLNGHIDNQLVISIAGGIRIGQLSEGLGTDRVIRVMPNTPCLVGRGAAGFAPGLAASESDCEFATELFESVGKVFRVTEPQLDAVTGLSGSGPAYVYLVIEALSDGGVRMGLPRHVATQLAAQTVLGAAEMVLETEQHPGFLKDQVTSPGGTTIAGLHALERGAVRGKLMDAVEAATRRSQELGELT